MITAGDQRYLPLARRESGGFQHATRWYLRGWEPMGYQYVWHQVSKLNGTWVGGIATSKTSTTAASYTMDCLAYPYFRALNTSVTAKQAELPFLMLMSWIEGNERLEHLIQDIRLRPWPIITFKNYSTFEFRTAGLDARFIRGFEYDRINFDECALDTQGKIAEILRGRLRGTRPNGVARFCRLDTVSSPGAVLWFQERFDKGYDPKFKHLYFSMRTATWDNIHLTREQIEAMKAEMPPEIIAVELGAEWPDFGAAYFPAQYIDAAIDQDLYDDAYLAINPENAGESPKPGFDLREDPRTGILRYETPCNSSRRYIIAGDPGRGNPPGRNAGVVLVADVTGYPYKLVFFDWVSGNGSIRPFLQSYKYAIEKYTPERKGLDVTGTQAMLEEVAFQEEGIVTDGINYAADKFAMLNIHLNDLTRMRWKIPPIQGLVRQSKVYTLENDKDIPQDLITTWAQLSWLARDVPRGVVQVEPHINTLEYARRMRPLARGSGHPAGRRVRR